MTQRLNGAASGRGGAWVVGLLALCGFVVAAGCGGGSTEPVTARNSAFEAGEGDAATVAQGPGGAAGREDGASGNGAGRGASGGGAAATDSADSTGGGAPRGRATGDSPGSRGAAANRGAGGGAAAGGDDLDAAPPATPKSNAAAKAPAKKGDAEGKPGEGGDAAAEGIQVPDAPPEELLKVLANLERREPTGRNNRELVDNLRQWMAARLAIAEKVLSVEATPKQRVTAARAKRDVLIQMTQIGLPDTQQQMRSFCAELLADAAPEMVRLGRVTQLNLQLAMLISGATEDTKDLLESFDVALEDPTKDEELFQAVTGVAITLQQAGMNEQAQKAYKGIIGAFGEVKNERIALMVGQLAELSKLIDVGLDKKREAVLTGEPNANEELLGAVRQLLSDKPGPATLERLSALAQDFEFNRNYDLSGQIYASIGEAYKSHENKEVAEQAGKMIAGGQKRAALVGKPLAIEGKLLDGKPFDWKQYEGKIVLIDFWATWCAPCRAEIPNIKRNFDKYHDKGFEVVGINLDRDRGEVDRFFGAQTLPWATVVGADAFANHCGVESIPFVLLVGRDGRVIDLHVRGELLGKKLAEIFDGAGDADEKGDSKADSKTDAKTKPLSKEIGKEAKPITADGDKDAKPAEDAKPGEKPEASEKPAAGEKPASTEKPADETKKPEGGAWLRPAGRGVAASFVGMAALTTVTADEPKAGDKKADEKKADEKKADGTDEAKLPEGNPYLASSDLKPSELVDFIDRMQDKPKSIQSRAGFPEAIVDAADRVLAAAEATDKQKLLATVAKIETLHKQAVAGVAAADEQLSKFVDTLASDMRPQVARLVKFLLLERKAIAGNDAPVEQIAALLAEIKAYCEKESLEGRHLRLASSTVQVINRIESGDEREKRFEEFGKLFGKSSDKELARYGKKLAKAPEKKESDLVGQPLQLAGAQLDGQPLNWAAYRGKVVLVDFWATWCGPCLREMPNVREYYEKNKQRGFEVVGVSIDEDLDALATFLDKNKLPWPTMAGDGSKTAAQKYNVRAIPTMMAVDRDGKILGVAHRIQDLIPIIEKQLAAKAN